MRRRTTLALVWIAMIAVWEGAYRVIEWKSWVFPAPSHVVDAMAQLVDRPIHLSDPIGPGWPWKSGGDAVVVERAPLLETPLVRAIGVSAARLFVGFGVSLVIGSVLGVALMQWRFVDQLLGPLFLGLQTLPSVCWAPLAILVFGINERGILFVMVMGSAFAMSIGVRDGLRALPPIYRSAGRMLGASGVRLYTHVLIPASTPALAGALRQGFSFAWRSLLGAELILLAQRRGLGFLLSMGRDFSDVSQVVAVMAVMVGIGMAMDRWVFAVFEARVRTRFGLVPMDHRQLAMV